MSKICSKANRKLNVLSRMWSFLPAEKIRIILSPLLNHNSNTVLWIVNDYESTREELFSNNNCFSIHDQNIDCLATEIYKVANYLSVGDFKNLFHFKDKDTLRIPFVNTELEGKNLIRYFGVVICNAIPINIKTAVYYYRIEYFICECCLIWLLTIFYIYYYISFLIYNILDFYQNNFSIDFNLFIFAY